MPDYFGRSKKKTLTLHPLEPAKPLNDAQMAGRFFYDEQQKSIPEGREASAQKKRCTQLL